MFCSNCGTEMSDQAPACPKCGHPRATTRGPRTEATAVIALVLGVLGVISCPVVLSIPAVIVGNQSRNRIREDPSLEGDGMAKAGVILGWVGIGLGALFIVGAIIALAIGLSFGDFDGPAFRNAIGGIG